MGHFQVSQSVMFLALFFFALIRCGSSCSPSKPQTSSNSQVSEVCPLPKTNLVPEYGPVIAGGIIANRDDPIPYQLSIRKLNPSGNCQWSHICGAVILDEKTAVTAAHCFVKTRDVSQYRVYAGENRLDVPGEANEQVLEVKKLIMHPSYVDVYNGNDIAILHVDKFLFNKYAQPALLSSVSTATLSNLTAMISGWGNFSDNSGLSNSLRKGYLEIEPPQNCTSRLEHKMRVPVREGIVCALGGATRVCSGDSGGPLVIQNYNVGNSTGNLLVGITSFAATSCSGQNRAGAFTEISHFYYWILENRDPPQLPKHCSEAMEILKSPRFKKQRIFPHGNRKNLEVLCDFETDGGGWTIIQKRSRGPKEEFKQNWSNYTQGFGSLDGNFWLGLENIRALTKNGDQELRIELEDFEGEKRWAKYSSFSISDASDFYRLSISGFSGDSTLRDTMAGHWTNNGQKFTTIDKDNDNWSGNCAVESGGAGWWFSSSCGAANLNGLYFEKGETVPDLQGIFWWLWKGWNYSMAKSEMKIRTRKP